jgi:ATP-binding cassette, subfamily B, bacterial
MKRDGTIETLLQARRLFALGKPPLWTLFAVPATIVATALLSVLPPLLIGNMIDSLTHRNAEATFRQLMLYVGITLLLALVGLAGSYSSSAFRETLTRNIQLHLLEKLNRSQYRALSLLTFGQLTNRSIGDPRTLCNQLEYSLFPTLYSVCTLAATIVAMVRVDYRLALIAIGFSVLVFVPLRLAGPHISALQKRMAETTDAFSGEVADFGSLAALTLLRNGAAARHKQRRLESVTSRLLHLRIRQVFVGGISGVASTLSGTLGPGALMAYGAYLAVHGQIGAGAIVTLLIYQSRMSGPLNSLSALQLVIASMGVATRRLLEVADLPEEISGSVAFEPGPIVFAGVRTEHDGREVLRGIDVTIEQGSHIVLAGPSGAGKSSLANLFSRLHDPSRGSIKIGPNDLRSFALESLRAAVCVVPQDPVLFDASLLDNLTVTCPQPKREDIETAIRLAQLEGVIERLPLGLEAHVGQRGFKLSGGERQRICLARALLQQPQVLVLDEALTGVDVETEQRILRNIRSAFRGRTLVVITHRLEGLETFDRVIRLERGCTSVPEFVHP